MQGFKKSEEGSQTSQGVEVAKRWQNRNQDKEMLVCFGGFCVCMRGVFIDSTFLVLFARRGGVAIFNITDSVSC